MTEMKMRRKRVAEDDEEDEFYHSPPNKRGRAGSAAFKWLWAPSPHPDEPRPQGLWPDTERLFRTQSNHRDFNLPRSFSLPPETSSRRTSRRRGAISVTSSPPPSELDRHLAMQLQQQIAIIRLKAASRGADDDEVERMRRELEDVQIDAALPSILGISLDFDRKLDLGSSRSPQGSEQRDSLALALALFSRFLSSSLAMCLSQQLRVGSRGTTTTNMTGPMNLPKPLLPGRRSNMRDPI
ncbi:hypothetical protein CGGC5_v008702 [Colletotrichum fructicola Nara gc5]|uniref:Uncharacterized protein n=1 Tax=Colletotrichum fructicola (strain Nara gc5) TaxID=1213859 RepID=A0A7J6J3G2_COLFN|nr:hypothetical protein CGGC5_v008702 [Colletotrichum fructicola Nara gc5]KAF5508810.1 hypothetical protein CGCF413_v004031 [Colletotrichum fructicola]